MFKLIGADIMVEELNKKSRCESCGLVKSEFLYLSKHGYCNVISHVCGGCKDELERLTDGAEKAFMSKEVLPK
jgi:Zn finger protein HypA/HybF involved in hydrogenase expression